MRKFEIVKRIEDEIELPKRSTKNSAGYDFFAIEDVVIEPIGHLKPMYVCDKVMRAGDKIIHTKVKPTLVKTGIKAQMMHNEFLLLANRSSNPKKGLILANGVGIIDSDYYGNEDNDGEIMFPFLNIGEDPIEIKKGDKLGQGIFMKYYMTDDDVAEGERLGGFGSTDKNYSGKAIFGNSERIRGRVKEIQNWKTEREKMQDEFENEEAKFLNEEGD